jgi:hypothetical protein
MVASGRGSNFLRLSGCSQVSPVCKAVIVGCLFAPLHFDAFGTTS